MRNSKLRKIKNYSLKSLLHEFMRKTFESSILCSSSPLRQGTGGWGLCPQVTFGYSHAVAALLSDDYSPLAVTFLRLVTAGVRGQSPRRSDLRPLCGFAAAPDPLAGGSSELLQSNFRREAAEMDEAPLIENQRGVYNPPVLKGGFYIQRESEKTAVYSRLQAFFEFRF